MFNQLCYGKIKNKYFNFMVDIFEKRVYCINRMIQMVQKYNITVTCCEKSERRLWYGLEFGWRPPDLHSIG